MSDLDRYDVAFSLLEFGLAMVAIKLGVDVRLVLLVVPVGVAFPLFRHLPMTPTKLRRAESERESTEAMFDRPHVDACDSSNQQTVNVNLSSRNANRLHEVAARRGQRMDEALADLLREAEQRTA